MSDWTERAFSRRARCLILFLGGLYALLVAKFFHLQVLNADKWRSLALKQHTLIIHEPAERGRFWTNGNVKPGHPAKDAILAMDCPEFHLHADPQSLPVNARQPLAAQLARHLHSEEKKRQSAETAMIAQMSRKSRDRTLAEWITPYKRAEIETWWLSYHRRWGLARNAIFFTRDYRRTHPLGPLMGNVIQTVRRQRGDGRGAVPIGGLEQTFDDVLRGSPGTRRLLRSLKNPMETGVVTERAKAGADIYLTINHVLQAIAEEELIEGAKRCGAKGGWALVMDPWTGYVLALAQYPRFELARYWEYFNGDTPNASATRPRALCDTHEPGSIFKPLNIAIALEANRELRERGLAPLFDPEERMSVASGNFPGRKRPLRDVAPRNFCNLNLAVQKSSNVYMARLTTKLIERLGARWYRDRLSQLGVEEKTGVLSHEEACGSLPKLGSQIPKRFVAWSAPTPIALSLGHSIQLNAFHIARGYCALANGGCLVRPKLIRKIAQSDGTVLSYGEPPGGPRIFSPATAERVLSAMRFVTLAGGTGTRAASPDFAVCGKTGTAEKVIDGHYDNRRFLSSFAGIAPARRPRLVVLVSLDEPAWGTFQGVAFNHRAGICAAPIFREITSRCLHYLSEPKALARDSESQQGELKRLRELDRRWNRR